MPGSMLVVEERFASGDPAFLDELRAATDAKALRAFAEKWYRDPRPWARERLQAYLDAPLECPGHEALVKKLFKTAEAAGDDATMARFMVALDRSVRRVATRRWDYQIRAIVDRWQVPRKPRPKPLFKTRTRRHLRRRAWRYFRRTGFRDPERYLKAVLGALVLYADADCDSGIHFLDNWGLVHALFARSPVLRKTVTTWWVRDGQALRDLKPAPAFPKAWEGNSDAVFLLLGARARPVRRTALAMVKAQPGLLAKIPVDRLVALFESADADVQALATELLAGAGGLESVPMDLWLRLLESKNLEVLQAVCDVMQKVVAPDRLATAQLLAFACAPLGPVAKLGVAWLGMRKLAPAELLELANVRAESAAADAVALARARLEDPEAILPFVDSTTRAVREAAWRWFAEDERTRSRVDLWAKLVESPYDDVRLAIVAHLEKFARIDTALRVLLSRAPLEAVWATVLLNVNRGNRAKRLAASQIADVIERAPERAPQLLPLLRVAARSIRGPEFRAGLAAVVRAVTRRPELAAAVSQHFPELKL